MDYIISQKEYETIKQCLIDMIQIEDVIVIATDASSLFDALLDPKELEENKESIKRIRSCISRIDNDTKLMKHRIRETLNMTSFYDPIKEKLKKLHE